MDAAFNQHTGILSPWVDGMRARKVAANIAPGAHVLDIGCGPALLKPYLPAQCRYTGVDSSADVVRSNSDRFPNDKYIQLNAVGAELPFPTQEFDVVVLAAFVEHIDEPGPLFKEVGRVLKSSGKVIVTTPSTLGGLVHEVLAHTGFLSHHAAEEHKGFWNKKKMEDSLKGTTLLLKSYVPFQFGLNQLFILERSHS